jgi:hypothetical protein
MQPIIPTIGAYLLVAVGLGAVIQTALTVRLF